jgi:hypothetical protein
MKHNNANASPYELACAYQPVRHAPTQEAKPTSYSPTVELCTFSAAIGADSLPSLVRASAAARRLTSLPSPYGPCGAHRGQGEGALSFDIHQNLDFPIQNQFPKLNLIAVSEVAQASGQSGADLLVQRLPGPGLPASSTPPSTLNPEFSQPIHPRSACSAYHFQKSVETTAEILLRFAETSQQTLRQISLLATTYNNFAEKNALKSNLLRLLRLDRSLAALPFHSRPPFGAWTARSARHFRNTRNTPKTHARHTRNTLKNTVETHEFLRQTQRNTQNTLFFLRGAHTGGFQPSDLPAGPGSRHG